MSIATETNMTLTLELTSVQVTALEMALNTLEDTMTGESRATVSSVVREVRRAKARVELERAQDAYRSVVNNRHSLRSAIRKVSHALTEAQQRYDRFDS